MIPLIEINHIAENYHVAAETIEKDYVISWILLCLSKSMIIDNFIFYGGTANHALKINWDVRLSKQIAVLPNVESVIKEVELKLRELFIQID